MNFDGMHPERRRREHARRLTLAFSGAHVVVCVAGLIWPAAYGLGLADSPMARRRLRWLAAIDLTFAAAVTDGVLADLPLRRRLRVGAASDLARALALQTLFAGRARRSRQALSVASLLGATAATVLADRVDEGRVPPARAPAPSGRPGSVGALADLGPARS